MNMKLLKKMTMIILNDITSSSSSVITNLLDINNFENIFSSTNNITTEALNMKQKPRVIMTRKGRDEEQIISSSQINLRERLKDSESGKRYNSLDIMTMQVVLY